MAAATVPPTGWHPQELRPNTRRSLSRALVISGAGHLVVLAAVLWLQSRGVEREPRLILTPAYLVPPPSIIPPIPFRPPSPNRPSAPLPDGGVIQPVETMAPLDPKIPTTPVGTERRVETGPSTPPNVEPAADRVPTEAEFVDYDRPPVPYYRPAPEYPSWARDAGIEGRVVLHVLVGRDGRVTRVTVIQDARGLTDAARQAIARWLFHPALSGKNPVAVWVEIPVEFRL